MRIQLDLADSAVAQIKDMMAEANIKTYSEIFGNALAILNWTVKETRNGRGIFSVDEKNNKTATELVAPVLEAVKQRTSVKS